MGLTSSPGRDSILVKSVQQIAAVAALLTITAGALVVTGGGGGGAVGALCQSAVILARVDTSNAAFGHVVQYAAHPDPQHQNYRMVVESQPGRADSIPILLQWGVYAWPDEFVEGVTHRGL